MKQGQLSTHFFRYEFTCKCGCGFDTVDAELIHVLEIVRLLLGGHTVTINSGCRCEKHNEDIGGSAGSLHLDGKAADIVIKDVHADTVADCLEDIYPDRYGIGRYDGRTHIDVRPGFARWDKRAKHCTLP